MSESFEQRFCRRFGVPSARFVEAMLQRTLYRRAQRLRWLISCDALAADRCFVSSVGRLTRRTDFPDEVKEFRYDRRNQSFWRHTLRFRVSIARTQTLFREVWPESAPMPAATRAVAGGTAVPRTTAGAFPHFP